MKIAIAASEEGGISHHFGRSFAWLIFSVEEGQVQGPESRRNTHSHHARTSPGGCADHDEPSQPHGHGEILEALHDCQAVISGGMGWRAAEDLQRHGIRPFVVDCRHTPEEAVRLYLAGQLSEIDQQYCRGRHETS